MHATKQTWTEMAERAQQLAKEKIEAKRASEGAASSSGAARPAFDEEGLTAEEARCIGASSRIWLSPSQAISSCSSMFFVAGCLVVATGGDSIDIPHFVDKLLWVRSAGRADAFYNALEVSGEGITRS